MFLKQINVRNEDLYNVNNLYANIKALYNQNEVSFFAGNTSD